MSEIVFCSVFRGRTPEVVQNIRNHSPFVDRTFIVLHGNVEENKDNIEFFESAEGKRLNVSWELADVPYSPTGLRNTYLHKMPPGTWCLQFDCDEFLEPPGCYMLRNMVAAAEQKGANRLAFNAHDIRIGLDGSVGDNLTNYFNPVFIRIVEGTSWVGETHGGINTPRVETQIGQVSYRYYHIKSAASEFLRGCRNYWTTGASAQNNTQVPEWVEFKKLCASNGVESFDGLYQLMLTGDVPEDLKHWVVFNRNNENPEAASWFVVYFGLMHPEQNIYLAGSSHLPYDKDRKQYQGEMTY
jgi:hypothetical protein